MTLLAPTLPQQHKIASLNETSRTIGYDTLALCLIITLANLHLFTNLSGATLVFLPDAVTAGEWWRLVTFPFVHVSWYHLLLDAGAFLLLYRDIAHNNFWIKLSYLTACAVFSVSAALIASPLIDELGLCGLSGIAHGLMAISALDMMTRNDDFKVGLCFFVIVVGKSMYEAATGTVFLEFLHMGMCGSPVAVSHAGGVLGGIVAFQTVSWITRRNARARHDSHLVK